MSASAPPTEERRDRASLAEGLPAAGFPIPRFVAEGVEVRGTPVPDPERVVVIRLHAFGDVAITFPLVAALRKALPGTHLTFVTDPRNAGLVRAHRAVDSVVSIDARASRPRRAVETAAAALRIVLGGRPVVLDLQRNEVARALTPLVAPRRVASFDRFAPRSALSRYLEAAEAAGLGALAPVLAPHASEAALRAARERLRSAGVDPARPIACLNPAGGWETKQWPLDRFVETGLRLHRRGWQLLLLGSAPVSPRHASLRDSLGERIADLSGATTQEEALALVALLSLVVSEDSGLMHLAWVQGVPTVALFGSTRSAWSRPEGERSTGFFSEDLECGACMQPSCARGDLACLARVTVDDVMDRVQRVVSSPLLPERGTP